MNKKMFISFLILVYQMFGARLAVAGKDTSNQILFNFNNNESLSGWVESSDTVREVGMSKATLVIQKTQIFQRAVFFTMLNPQPNGAGFAGMNCHSEWDLSNFQAITLNVRGQGANKGYKIVLRHKNQNREPYPTFEQTFTAPMNKFDTVVLPITGFKPYYRGKPLNETENILDKSFVSSIGLQVYGGVYLPEKQSGVSSLEIDWIKAV